MKKILLVEDNIVIRRFTSYLLMNEGYDVQVAENGLQALKEIKPVLPDAIVCDLMMPEMDGYEFVEKVKQDPELAGIPVIIISANDNLSEMEKLKSMGILSYITKPYPSKTLVELLQRAIA